MIRLDVRDGALVGDADALADRLAGARKIVALTGAGISVDSGVPDFRSPGGLWKRFDPATYATLACFLRAPERSWELFRALGATLAEASPNAAHHALAELERDGILDGVVTQNVDGLHQAAGSRRVAEIHGSHDRLECLRCEHREPMTREHLHPGPIPRCPRCTGALKPAVVLFGEAVRDLDAVEGLLDGCDALLVVGTSAEIAPACLIPGRVARGGGTVVELNVEPALAGSPGTRPAAARVLGPARLTVPALARLLARPRPPRRS